MYHNKVIYVDKKSDGYTTKRPESTLIIFFFLQQQIVRNVIDTTSCAHLVFKLKYESASQQNRSGSEHSNDDQDHQVAERINKDIDFRPPHLIIDRIEHEGGFATVFLVEKVGSDGVRVLAARKQIRKEF